MQRDGNLSLCLPSHQALPLLCSEQQHSLDLDGEFQHLYAAVTQTRKRKRQTEEEPPPPAEEPDLLASSLGLSDFD